LNVFRSGTPLVGYGFYLYLFIYYIFITYILIYLLDCKLKKKLFFNVEKTYWREKKGFDRVTSSIRIAFFAQPRN